MGNATLPYTGTNGAVLRAAIVYLFTGFATFLAMGLLGFVMRLDHAGMKPLAWAFDGHVLRVASDCDALRELHSRDGQPQRVSAFPAKHIHWAARDQRD